MGILPGGCKEAPQRFIRRFAGKDKGLMMDGNEITRADLSKHFPGLFGRCVRLDPGRIPADGQNGYVNPAFGACFLECIGVSSIASEKDGLAVACEKISVVTVRFAPRKTLAPMSRFDRGDPYAGHFRRFAPAQLGKGRETQMTNMAGIIGRHYHRCLPRQLFPTPDIEMVKMRVRLNDQIEPRQPVRLESAGNQAPRTKSQEAQNADANAFAEYRVGDDMGAVKINQQGGVSQPTQGQLIVAPTQRFWPMVRGAEGTGLFPATLPDARRQPPTKLKKYYCQDDCDKSQDKNDM